MLVSEFAKLIDRSDKILTVVDAVGTVLAQNDSIQQLGYEPADVLGTHIFQYVHPGDLLRVMKAATAYYMQVGLVGPVEFRFLCRDGEHMPVRVSGFNLGGGGGRVGAFFETDIVDEELGEEEPETAPRIVIPFEPISAESAEAKRKTAMAKLTTVLDGFSSGEIETLYEELTSLD
jgi:PAS domain S-box-containing protein